MCCKDLADNFGKDKATCFDNSNVAKENGREFRLETDSAFCKLKIDGCLITSDLVRKCDYAFKLCNTNHYILVELKGTDVGHAVAQIVDTIPFIKNFDKAVVTLEGYIVSSAVPQAAEMKFRKIKEEIKKKNGLNIKKQHIKAIVVV